MITVLHNPSCSKSRSALDYLAEKGIEPEVVKYMDEPLRPDELEEIIDLLGIAPHDLIRTSEDIYKEEFEGKELTDEEWILAMLEYPMLMERPIIINGDKAVIGRPIENIDSIL